MLATAWKFASCWSSRGIWTTPANVGGIRAEARLPVQVLDNLGAALRQLCGNCGARRGRQGGSFRKHGGQLFRHSRVNRFSLPLPASPMDATIASLVCRCDLGSFGISRISAGARKRPAVPRAELRRLGWAPSVSRAGSVHERLVEGLQLVAVAPAAHVRGPLPLGLLMGHLWITSEQTQQIMTMEIRPREGGGD